MRRIFKLIGAFLFLFLIYQFIVLLFVKSHDISYTLSKGKNRFQIKEHFKILEKKHLYTFEILDNKKRTYHFQVYENYNKQQKIIDTIEFFETGNISCIYPVLKDRRASSIACRKGKEEVSFQVLLQEEKPWILEVINTLSKKGYQEAAWNLSNSSKVYKDTTYYQENITTNQSLSFWTYRGVYLLTKNDFSNQEFLEIDQYENNKSILVNEQLIVIDSDQSYDFDQFYVISLFNNQIEKMKVKEKISQDSYFTGTVDGCAYLIDRKNKKQYKINPRKKQITLVGDTNRNAQYYNGKKWSIRNIYDFLKQDLFFPNQIIDSTLQKIYPDYTLYNGIGRTYLIKDQSVFYVTDEFPKKKIRLFTLEDLKEIKMVENQFFFISKDTIYQYTDEKGLRPILSTRELTFNAKNRYSIALKK